MIIKMKKITLLCIADERETTLNELRKLGLLHLKHITAPEGKDIDALKTNIERTHNAIAVLKEYQPKTKAINSSDKKPDAPSTVNETHELVARHKALTDEQLSLKIEHARIEPLGDFRTENIRELEDKGIFTKIYKAPAKTHIIPPENTKLFILNTVKGNNYFAIVGQEIFTCDHEEISIPSESLSSIQNKIDDITTELSSITARLQELSICINTLESSIHHLKAEIEYQEAQTGMGQGNRISYLQGFCPDEAAEAIKDASAKHGWGVVIEDTSEDDAVPTLIKSPKWVKPIDALFQAIEILPGYHEVDASVAFLFFFSIFFGILVGDAGYGAIFMALTLVARYKMKNAPAYPFWLLGILSGSTIAWGVITSNYFGCGLPMLDRIAKIEWLSSERNLFVLCFLIGAIHLSIAHIWRAIRTINSTKAIAQVGWLMLTWFMYFAAKYLVLGEKGPQWLVYGFIAGVIMIIFDIVMRFKEAWPSLTTLFFDVIGNFVDVVSYIRLYAVGMAGLAVAQAFNALALGSEGHVEGFLAGLGAALILFLGHALNMVLCIMSVLVHGVRLNTLEFSGHIGLEWGGFPYKPFSQKQVQEETK